MAKLKEIKAGEYSGRGELENYVRSNFGLTTEPKETKITGSEAELKRLNLKDGSMFWGMGCVCTDGGKKNAPTERVPRGRRTSFGIENREEEREAPKD